MKETGVGSKFGTQFRIWATRTLREHLLRGYTLNERRLREKGLGEMEQAVGLLAKTLTQHALVTDEWRAVLRVVQAYTRAWRSWPKWHAKSDDAGALKAVMTGSATDPLPWQQHIRSKSRPETLADRFKDPEDALQIVIVRDTWLTGFDVPCLHTMYVDKPVRGHGLMQAIGA